MENSMVVLWKLKIELLYDPTMPFLGLYPKKLKAESQRDIYTPVLTTAFFTLVNPNTHQQMNW